MAWHPVALSQRKNRNAGGSWSNLSSYQHFCYVLFPHDERYGRHPLTYTLIGLKSYFSRFDTEAVGRYAKVLYEGSLHRLSPLLSKMPMVFGVFVGDDVRMT